MSNNDNKWEQPESPPPPLFTGKKEKDLVKQVADELIERVIGVSVLYYPISLKHSDFHELYGEAINKTYLPPVHVEVLAEWEGEETATTGFGIDKKSSVTLHFHKRRLTEDQNLFVREGDFVQYGEQKYEIVTLSQPRLLFGQPDAKIEIVAKCVRARDGSFPSQSYPDPSNEDPRLTAPACDPIEEIRVLTGDTTSTGGSGTQPCGEVYQRPGTPPPPLFTGAKEGALVKQIGDEILERVVGQQIVYFPVSLPHSNFHELYGESINKTFLPPIRVFAAVDWKGSETTTTSFGIDRKSAIDVKFQKRRLTEDQNLFVREGDFVLYGTVLYEIVTVGQPRLLFGKIDEKYEVVATCIRAREGTFKLSEVPGKVGDFELDSVTACDNANLVIPDGVDNTMANVGSGEGIFKNKTDIQFNLKTLVAGDNIVLNSTTNEIEIGLTSSISVQHISSSGIEFSGNIIPAIDVAFDLGSTSRKIRDLYISTGSIHFGDSHSLTIDPFENLFDFSSGGAPADLKGNISNAKTASYIAAEGVDGTVLSASFAHTASYVLGGVVHGSVTTAKTASYIAASNIDGTVLSASFAHTASYIVGSGVFGSVKTAQTASYVKTAQTASYVETAQTASYVKTAQTASYVKTALTASHYIETDTLETVLTRGNTSTGSIFVTTLTASAIEARGHYLPGTDATYDIGSADKQIRDLYISTGSIIFGGTHKIEVNSETNTFNFDAPAAEGITIPCVEQISAYNYANGTLLYDTSAQKFKFRQDSQWVELGSGGSSGAGDTITIAGIGSGILSLTDDTDGPNRTLLQEYTSNSAAYSGKTLYLANSAANPVGPFSIGAKFYFNEGGVWHPSHFFSTEAQQNSNPLPIFPDMQDILSLDASRTEDYAVLNGLHQNSASYGGRAIYLSNTGSSAIGSFTYNNKYYFNEGGTWFASSFISEQEGE
tara:strand:- start:5663 stop:8488 length:2826 start_codon:yes stop_codon:yes gene_type:complete